MKHGLFWKLFFILVAGTVVLFAGIHWLVNHTEQKMSFIAEPYQHELTAWANHAEQLYTSGQLDELNRWIIELQRQEQTWVAVVTPKVELLAGDHIDATYRDGFYLGRSIEWMIHLYLNYEPVMDFMFADRNIHFLIRLPKRMKPGQLWQTTQLLLQIGLPFVVLAAVCLLLYRHIVSPIRTLEKTTSQFASGQYDVRVCDSLGDRHDELASLAATFDTMAEHTGGLIVTQRQLIADLSHELRTPITRMEIALNAATQNPSAEVTHRLRQEVDTLRALSEDALTLAWMDTEKPVIDGEDMDLVDLVDSIVDNAGFEYSDRHLVVELPETAVITGSSSRLLGQAIENVIRNALRYTSVEGQVIIQLDRAMDTFVLSISDQGPGVPEQHLQDIFKPFFRVEKSRGKDSGGFGMGLALAKRQIEAVSGQIYAENGEHGGLKMTIMVPV